VTKQIRWAIVGCGDIARKRVAPAINTDENSSLEMVIRRDAGKVKRFAEEFGSRKYATDISEALRDEEVDAVYIATPVNLHMEQTVASAEAGKHVLCEKPMAMNADECRRMISAARQNGVTLGVAYYRRFYPKVERVKALLDSGELGRIVLVSINLRGWYNPAPDDPKRWRIFKDVGGGGPLMDVGSHRLDLLVYFFGLPERVTARCRTLVHDWDVEDSVSLLMELKNGASAVAQVLWSTKAGANSMEIIGERGGIALNPVDAPELKITINGRTSVEHIPLPENAHLPLIRDFALAIKEKRPPRITGEEGMKTTQIIDAAYIAQRENRWVELE